MRKIKKYNYFTIMTILIVFSGGAQSGSLISNKTVNITLNPDCDGFSLSINQKTGMVTGTRIGPCTANEPIIGTVGNLSNIGAAITIMSFSEGVAHIYIIDDTPKKWTKYDSLGNIVHYSTYYKGAP